MSAGEPTSTADRAARQVERIVEAAQEAAGSIREQAREELELARQQAEREREKLRADARRDSDRELNESRKQAIALAQDARREADAALAAAKRESEQLREQTQRAVQGRVTAAQKAADEVLAEARALSGGMRQLGSTLSEQADRMLRDVQAAHKRMQADLRIGPSEPPAGRSAGPPADPADTDSVSAPRSSTPARLRANPFEDLDPPSWVARDR